MPTLRIKPRVPEKAARARRLLRRTHIATTSELTSLGLTRSEIGRLVAAGTIERAARGLYRLPDADVTELHGVAVVMRKAPRGIICLISALRIHGLTTQAAYEVWIAIDHKARSPAIAHPPIRVVRMSGAALEHGVENRIVEGVPVRVFSAAKTVADCFKYRNKIGLDVALEALRDYRRKHRGRIDDLYHAAKACRVERTMRPYLEATS